MEVPDKIYVPQHLVAVGTIQELDELIVEGSVEYIRKEALLEWAKSQKAKLKQGYKHDWKNDDTISGISTSSGRRTNYEQILLGRPSSQLGSQALPRQAEADDHLPIARSCRETEGHSEGSEDDGRAGNRRTDRHPMTWNATTAVLYPIGGNSIWR